MTSNKTSFGTLKIRLAAAGGVLTTGVTALLMAAQLGVVHVGAGDVKIELGRRSDGLTMDIARRTCPPYCGVDFDWRPLARLNGP